ncbi:regulator of G-protein signaling 19-like [Platysternon megacephalum]|uniref:Regulator of G-protein signaling 19-like n=1 Tax=Platysternon megacephalum TaxID=55544 RepID=A0A4D9F1F9_9SAUR|nr:regulator of G-protein signaling 19-like [Platysternon megacephalum]
MGGGAAARRGKGRELGPPRSQLPSHQCSELCRSGRSASCKLLPYPRGRGLLLPYLGQGAGEPAAEGEFRPALPHTQPLQFQLGLHLLGSSVKVLGSPPQLSRCLSTRTPGSPRSSSLPGAGWG